MARDTLLDLFRDFGAQRGTFLVYDDGYRSWSVTYAEVRRAADSFASRLDAAGLRRDDKIIIWGENRPEWVIALWGALQLGVVVVPIDYRASAEVLQRVHAVVRARVVLVGEEVTLSGARDAEIWRLRELLGPDAPENGGRGRPSKPSGDARPRISRDDVAEIIFTSGATADPKGVIITHRNVLANVVPVERELAKYRKYARPFAPIRFLNLLPLSHLFGQAMATFIPPMLPGTVIFIRGYNPAEIVRQIKTRRVSVLVCVPKILDVLRDHIVRVAPEAAEPPPGGMKWYARWWRYRRVHRMLGFKFWAFVVGAAPLGPELEEFWTRLGFVVVQGYGLTETAPIVTLNHPFETRRGTVGTPIAGVEVKIAPDGEILVRGENVTRGYYNAPEATAASFEEGWFHTGDLGGIDEEGRLFVRGRKKEVIVTPEGLNVYPDDVERVLLGIGGVRDAAAVGVTTDGQERVHAVLVLDPGTNPQEVVRHANALLEDHQKIRGTSGWADVELPRTEGTRKLKRTEIKRWVDAGERDVALAAHPDRGDPLASVLSRYAGRDVAPGTTIEELGLSSLERVELMMELEARFQTSIDEGAFAAARDVGELRQLLDAPAQATVTETMTFPAWSRSAPAWFLRRLALPTWILPLTRVFARIETRGVERFARVSGPVIFAANHQSHMDTPVILAALPPGRRYRVAPAMAKEFFKAHFFPEQHTRAQWLTNSVNYYLAALYFNAFPLPQREVGARQTLRYAGDLVDEGWSILIFPEGRRVEDSVIAPFQGGIGMLGARLGVPVVPVRIEGLDYVLPASRGCPRVGRVVVSFGDPMELTGDDYAALARKVEEAVTRLGNGL